MKRITFSTKMISFPGLIFLLGFLFAGTGSLKAQNDDPNLDQLPRSLWGRIINPSPSDIPLSSIISIDNWDNFSLGIDAAENNMAANPNIPTWYFTAYNTNVVHHTENGIDWANASPSFGATMRGDPVSAYDSLGNLYYENMFESGGFIAGVKVIKSANNGATWGASVTALDGNDKNWIACDQSGGPYSNYVYTCMTNNSAGNFARSIDGGATFQSTFAPTTQNVPGMMVCVGPKDNVPGGAVYVVTNSGSSFASVYTFYRSTDGGQNFTQMSVQNFANYVGTNVNGRNAVEGMRTRPYPLITADNSYGTHRGRLYLVYASNDPPGDGNKPDIWCRYSDNGGATWSTAIRVNDDPNPTTHNQWHPGPWCDKETGKLYIQWMDTRDTPTSDSAFIYATYSADGGQTFVANQQISNKKMKIDCPTCSGTGNPRYQGDYNGIISNRKVAMAGWTDFRNGNFMSTTAYFPDFAMAVDMTEDTLSVPNDSTIFNVSIPAVKLYSDTVVLSASIHPLPAGGSIDFSYPQGNTITTFPGSKPVMIKLSGLVPVVNYQAYLVASGPNGTPAHRRIVTLRIRLSSVVNVLATAAPSSVCPGSNSQLEAVVSGGQEPYTYLWTPTTGLSDPNISNPLAAPLATTYYTVTIMDLNNEVAVDSVIITVLNAPATPGAISGPDIVCHDSEAIYSILPVPTATSYSWTVPAGANIISGQNTPQVNVNWGTTGGNLSVIAGNDCGNSNPRVKAVSIVELPATPAAIIGPDLACPGANTNFSVNEVIGASSYFWTIPAGSIITTGQNTATITVQWGFTAGDVTVMSQNACGNSAPETKPVGLEIAPGPAGTISGDDTVCTDHSYSYHIASIPQATSYIWTLPQGAAITSGAGTENIEVLFAQDAIPGNLSVLGQNTCGSGSSSTMALIVKTCSGIPEHGLNAIVTIYPNPTTGLITVSVNGREKQLEVVIMNISGQVVQKQNWDKITPGFSKQLDMSGFAKGVYYLKFINHSRVSIEKVVLH